MKQSNKNLYQKEINRIKRYTKKHYGQELDLGFDTYKPKRISKKKLEEIKTYRGKKLAKAVEESRQYVDIETGEITYLQPQKAKRLKVQEITPDIQSNYISNTTDYKTFDNIIIQNFKQTVNQYNGSKFRERILEWVNKLVQQNGEHAVAKMLQTASNNGIIIDQKVMYDESENWQYITNTMDYLEEQGEIYKEDIIEYMQEIDSMGSYESYD